MTQSPPPNQDAPATPTAKSMDAIVALCRRRGFIWQSSEIYGGINGFWDYGPLGTELKKNLKDAWWHDMVRCPPKGPDGQLIDMVGVDCTIIMNPKVWVASGHVAGFNDPMVDDKETKQRFRADHLVGLFLLPRDLEPGDYMRKFMSGEIANQWKPVATVIASSAAEATSNILDNPRSLVFDPDARLRVKSVEVEDVADPIKVAARLLKLHFQTQTQLADLIPIPGQRLRDHPDDIPSPFTGKRGALTEPRMFNLMFESHAGPIKDEANKVYLRPETAQGIFANYRNVLDTTRVKVPFGIAQQGKAFRNEVTPRNFTFRSREFEQMEIEFFIRPDTAKEWYAFWRDTRMAWWRSVGLTSAHLQLREHGKDELSHYAKEGAGTSDIEYQFPFTAPGYGELEGVAHRTDFDLRQHAAPGNSGLGDKLKYFDQELQLQLQAQGVAKEEIAKQMRYFPHVIEPSAGADRGTLAVLCEAYTPDPARPSGVVMKFHPRLAPVKAGVYPLVNKDGMPEIAEKLYLELRQKYAVEYDPKQAIGKRYARMDEAGTPFCFTIDSDTLKDQTVTVRHRDTLQQERIGIDKVGAFLAERIGE